MTRTRHAGYTKAELDRLYDLTDSWTDIGASESTKANVEFIVEDLRVCYTLPVRTAKAVVQLARRRRTSPERLIERWVREKLQEAV
jgi:hypothetical protein